MATRKQPARTDYTLDDFLAAGYRVPQEQVAASAPEAQPSKRTPIRAAADTGLEVASGAVKGIKFMSDVFGADNAVSTALDDVSKFAKSLQSAQAQGEDARMAQIMKEAEDKGIWEQVKAAASAVSEAPIRQSIGAVATGLPMIAASMVPGMREAAWGTRLATMGGLGAVQGVGMVKSSMRDAVYQRAIEEGRSQQEAAELADQAQSYQENPGQIALGGLMGGAATATGFAPAMVRALSPVGANAAKTMSMPTIGKALGMGVLKEVPMEAAQGGHEQLAGNVAQNSAGFATPLGRGVAGSAAMEGMLAAPGGTVGGAFDYRSDRADFKAQQSEKSAAAQAEADAAAAAIRANKQPGSGPLSNAVNAGTEADAQKVEVAGASAAAAIASSSTDLAIISPTPEGSAEFVNPDFQTRQQTLAEQMASPENREKVRARFGDDGLNQVLYYAQAAGRADIPAKTADNMLQVAERMMGEVLLQPLGGDAQLGGVVRDQLTLDAPEQTGAQPLGLGLDQTPSGRFTVDARGNAVPETAAQQTEAELRAESLRDEQKLKDDEAAILGQQQTGVRNAPEAPLQPVRRTLTDTNTANMMGTASDPVSGLVTQRRLNADAATQRKVEEDQRRFEQARSGTLLNVPETGVTQRPLSVERGMELVKAKANGRALLPQEDGFLVALRKEMGDDAYARMAQVAKAPFLFKKQERTAILKPNQDAIAAWDAANNQAVADVDQQPGDVLNPSGQPFKTKMAADLAAKKTPGAVVPVVGGFTENVRKAAKRNKPKTIEEADDAVKMTGIAGDVFGGIREEAAQQANNAKKAEWATQFTTPSERLAASDISRYDGEKLSQVVDSGRVTLDRANEMVDSAVSSGWMVKDQADRLKRMIAPVAPVQDAAKGRIKGLEERVNEPFQKEQELKAKRRRLNEVVGILTTPAPTEQAPVPPVEAKPSVIRAKEQPLTPAATIRAAITKAYGNLLDKLEGKGLVTIAQTEREAIEAAAQARADKTGGDVEQIKRQMLASVQMQRGGRMYVDPDTLIFREGDQNRTEGVSSAYTNTEDMPAIVVIIGKDGEKTILDGHNRASVALSRGDNLAAVSLTQNQYDELQNNGYDDIEIAYATLRENNENDAADDLESQFPGAGVAERGKQAWINFPDPDSESAVDVKYSANGNIEGFFDRQTGKSFLVADNLTAASAPGTLMHEVGIHMAADGKLEPLFKRAGSLLKNGTQNEFIQRVKARMARAGETSDEEAAAYIVTEYENDRAKAPLTIGKWLADLASAVRAWLFSRGVILKADQLTVADIAAVARANAQSLAKGGPNGGPGGGIRRSFAGEGAATADKMALATARQRIEAGENAETVRKDTGWFNGVDGKWRFEISDSDASIKDRSKWTAKIDGLKSMRDAALKRKFEAEEKRNAFLRSRGESPSRISSETKREPEFKALVKALNTAELAVEKSRSNVFMAEQDGGLIKVGDVLDHLALFSAYPKISETRVAIDNGLQKGNAAYSPESNTITIPGMDDSKQLLTVLLHEIQHGIQNIEGFATGGSPDLNGGFSAYKRLAGEVESRNTEARQGMTDAQRRETAPSQTADTPDSDVIVVFNGKDAMSAPAPANADPDIRFSRAADIADSVQQGAFSVKNATADQLAHYRGMGMQALGRRQIVDLYGDMLPELKQYDKLVQRMDADKNESGADADKLVNEWAKLDERSTLGLGAAKQPGMERKLAELMHDATLAQIDPEKPLQSGDNSDTHKALAARFAALTPKAQEVYRTARDMYAAHFKKVQAELQARIQRSGMDEKSKAKMIAKMDADLFGKLKGVYFPLARFGKYVVVSKNAAGETVSVSRAEKLAEANNMRREVVKNSPAGVTVSRVYKDAEFNATRDAAGKGFMSDLMTMLQGQGVSADVLDSVGQLYLSSLPDLSWAKHGIHRKGTPGFSQDARRAFAQNMFHGSRHLAKVRYSDQLADTLLNMEQRVKDQRDDEAFDQIKAQQVVDEMNKRHELLMNPKTNALSTAMTSVGFVWFLGLSPASALVNLSQTALVAYPVMASKWGFQKAGAALLSASAEVVRAGNDLSKVLAGEELAAFQKAVDHGTIDVTQAHDLAGVAQGEDERVAMAMRPVMRAASFMFYHAEKFNRQATFIAAYRLAKENGAGAESAFEQATKATYDGHFDYATSNRARIMQGNWQKVLFLFKQYGQNMVYTLMRQAYLSMNGMTDKQKAEARKQLGGLLTMHAMAAGALGLPIVGMLLSAASMLGSDDDDPWDAEVALKNTLADTFGPKAAEVMAHGLSRLTPWDLSGRVALNKLILPDIQEGLEGTPLWEKMLSAAAGPVAGIGGGIAKGMAEMGRGQYMRGLESMMPVALKNPIKAMRYAEEGAVDKTGVVIKDEVSLSGVAGQFSGFRPSDVALATEGRTAIYQANKALTDRRANIVRMYAQARMTDDAEGVQAVLKMVQSFNEKNPPRRITMPQLMQSVRGRTRRIEQAQQGVYLPKTQRDVVDAGRFAVLD